MIKYFVVKYFVTVTKYNNLHGMFDFVFYDVAHYTLLFIRDRFVVIRIARLEREGSGASYFLCRFIIREIISFSPIILELKINSL